MNLALFDFDGTITTRDSLIEFTSYCYGPVLFFFGMLIIIFPALVFFNLGIMTNSKAKEIFLRLFFGGWDQDRFFHKVALYSDTCLPRILRKKALEQIDWHKDNGDRIVVISASVEEWLSHWCRGNNIELIATKLEIVNNRITGRLASPNCHGVEKVRRIREAYNLDEYETIFAYGDTPGDKPMLELAHIKYYRWKKV